jgi:hypothetical protein
MTDDAKMMDGALQRVVGNTDILTELSQFARVSFWDTTNQIRSLIERSKIGTITTADRQQMWTLIGRAEAFEEVASFSLSGIEQARSEIALLKQEASLNAWKE